MVWMLRCFGACAQRASDKKNSTLEKGRVGAGIGSTALGNQVIRTRLENGLDAGRIRGKIRVIPRYSAAEPGTESAELRFRAARN